MERTKGPGSHKFHVICQGCGKKIHARRLSYIKKRKYCSHECYVKAIKGKDRKTLQQVFWDKVKKIPDGECWLWTGAENTRGYGNVKHPKKKTVYSAYRLSWEIANNRPIPEGLELDHTCRNVSCVNPDHLEPVTHQENVRRGFAARNSQFCPAGHDFRIHGGTRPSRPNARFCKECKRLIDERYLETNHEKILKRQKEWREKKKKLRSHTNFPIPLKS